ncbi:MAG: RtcB family protein [Candidatus Moranbacteria bacterium]|nr:RtcB family protein [Candidatus Moranbacteria bacterium]
MRVPARIYATGKMLDDIGRDRSLEQLINVTTLPGIQKNALVMPDAHEGYGFPIGGVAVTHYPDGVISPGGIGYDINCGVRLLKSNLYYEDARNYLSQLADELYKTIPSGVGRGGKLKLNSRELDEVLAGGVGWAVKKGYGEKEDMEHIESSGSLPEARPETVFKHAKNRGRDQLGTLGAGNHFLEIDRVDEIFDEDCAKAFGLYLNQIVILIHTGSRGLGHQVATDYIRIMNKAMPKYKISVPDRELVCVPFKSPEGQDYFSAMAAAANFAWTNRQLITWGIRKSWKKVLGNPGGELSILYDVAHNIAKIEEHTIMKHETCNTKQKLIVHRKGATRAFPEQPVIIPGSMGTASYVLVGTHTAMQETFGSTCHGAGRAMSRHAAKRSVDAGKLKRELEKKGIYVQAGSIRGLAEEAPQAYKDIDEVVNVVHNVGIALKVAKLRPLVVIKG